MRDQIQIGVLGLGRLGQWHAENLAAKVPSAKLVCVVDPLEGKAEKVARELGVEKCSQDPDDVFLDESIDAVVIVTPTSTHAEMIKKAAENGKQIFVEKPVTPTVEEADEVARVVRSYGVVCQVGFMRRFDSAYMEAKRRIQAGDIGKPIYFKATSRDRNCPPPEFIKNSGGIYLDMAIHDYDLARFLMTDEVDSVKATGNILVHQFMEKFNDVDQALTCLTFHSGASGDVETTRIAPYGYDIRGEVLGTEGAIQIGSMKHHDIKVLTNKGSTHDLIPDFPEKYSEAYLNEMIHFVHCISEGKIPNCTEVDGKAALEIAIAATKSFHTGETVTLNKGFTV